MYKREEVYDETLDYFKGDVLATDVWINKYCLKDDQGHFLELSPHDMHQRLAREFARIEQKYPNPLSYDTIFGLIKKFKYVIPQGSPMAGIGNQFQVLSLGNCFVIGNEYDSYGGILHTEEEMIHLMKRRGGVGTDLSHIRPKGFQVKNAAIASAGIVPFMERFSNGTREVAQDGRRGALMLTMSDQSYNFEDFIDAKLNTSKVTGANISVKLSDEFMRCVINDDYFTQTFGEDSRINSTKRLWKKLVHNAWKSAEPGILFWDTILSESPADCYADQGFKTVSTNPCGEIPLSFNDSCRLIAINLYSFVENPFTKTATFNFELFSTIVHQAQRLMDDLVDLEEEKIDQILEKIHQDPESDEIKQTEINLWKKIKSSLLTGRRTGLGITAEADMIAAMGLKYGSEEAILLSEQVHQAMALSNLQASIELAQERGCFPIWNEEQEQANPFLNRLFDLKPSLKEDYQKVGRRNIATMTIAPAGSISILSQTSSGIEPVYMTHYTRRRKINPNDQNAKTDFIDEMGDHWEEYKIFHPKLIEWAKINGYANNLNILNQTELTELIKKSPYYQATATELNGLSRVHFQGRIQKFIDHSLSSTVNLPEHTTEEEVEAIFLEAWKSGCKGITIYRDKCRSGVLISQDDQKVNVFKENHAPKRPKSLPCDIIRFTNRGEKWIGFLGLYDVQEPRPYEIFTGPAELVSIPSYINQGEIVKEKNGMSNIYNLHYIDRDGFHQEFNGLSRVFDREFWNIGRLVSAILRHSMPLPNVITLLDKLELDNDHVANWKNGVKRIIKHYIKEGTVIKGESCFECKMNTLIYKDGCVQCSNCGWSKCS